VPAESPELAAGARAPATPAASDTPRRVHVDVDGVVDRLVVVVGCPCLSLRRNIVVWTRRKKMTSLLVGETRFYPPARMDETCLFMEETGIVSLFMDEKAAFMERMCLVVLIYGCNCLFYG
jgi:hypothetical protein